MGNLHNERYDEIKSLIKKSKMLFEQQTQDNVATSVMSRLNQDMEYETALDDKESGKKTTPKDKVQKYRISGGILALHGKDRSDLDITSDEKVAFQETMDEFVAEVSDMVDFNSLNVYQDSVEWSGKLIEFDMDFMYRIGETNGVYVDSDMVKVDQEFDMMIDKLRKFYEKFKSKWAKIIASRKKTGSNEENE